MLHQSYLRLRVRVKTLKPLSSVIYVLSFIKTATDTYTFSLMNKDTCHWCNDLKPIQSEKCQKMGITDDIKSDSEIYDICQHTQKRQWNCRFICIHFQLHFGKL